MVLHITDTEYCKIIAYDRISIADSLKYKEGGHDGFLKDSCLDRERPFECTVYFNYEGSTWKVIINKSAFSISKNNSWL